MKIHATTEWRIKLKRFPNRNRALWAVFLAVIMLITSVPVNSYASVIKLSKKSISLVLTKSEQLKVKNSTGGKIKWSSSDKKIAAVSQKGLVKAKKLGKAVIYAKVKSRTLKCKVTVKAGLSDSKVQLSVGETKQVTLLGARIKSVKTSDSRIATVDKKGKITAASDGTAYITYKGTNKKSYKCKVTVKTDNNTSDNSSDNSDNNNHSSDPNSTDDTSGTSGANKSEDNSDNTSSDSDNGSSGGSTGGGSISSGSTSGGSTGSGSSDPSDNTVKLKFVANKLTAKNIPSEMSVKPGSQIKEPDYPEDDNSLFAGWYTDKELTNYFNFDKDTINKDTTLYANWYDYNSKTDSDSDGLNDSLEKILGTDPNKKDTDGDGLSDYDEVMVTGTDPLNPDSNGDGINDSESDTDSDGLTDKKEAELGTDPKNADSDYDDLTDYDEVNKYHTDPNKADTDGDEVSDGKEIELGTNPLTVQKTFDVTAESDDENAKVKASVEVTLDGDQVETLDVEEIKDDTFFPDTIPGYIGEAYDFSVDGTFDGKATLKFTFDKDLLGSSSDDFDPVIYYYNEDKQELEPLDTTVEGNTAIAETPHFSTYILLNRTAFESSINWIDYWKVSGDNTYSSAETVFVIDDSGSMYGNDRTNERLKVAQDLIDTLLDNTKVGVVRFASYVNELTSSLTDKESAKSLLTDEYFHSSGATYMYEGLESAINQFDTTDSGVYKTIVLLSDGDSYDSYKKDNVINKIKENSIHVFSVGLGNWYDDALRPIAEETDGAFYSVENAESLSSAFDKIGDNVDISVDSDNDGLPDYYEDNCYLFNNVKLPLDKYNPDTDGDGIKDGDEVEAFFMEPNADKTKMRVIFKIKSSPTSSDGDNDGLTNEPVVVNGKTIIPKDPDPLKKNGDKEAWEALKSYENKGASYYKTSGGINELKKKLLGNNVPAWLANSIVSCILKFYDALSDHSDDEVLSKIVDGFKLLSCINNDAATIAGAYLLNFDLDEKNDAYHSHPDTWQKKFGYNKMYDLFFWIGDKQDMKPLSLEPKNQNENERYRLWLWKGDYWNLHSGAEIGLYKYGANYAGKDHYKAIDQNVPMTLSLIWMADNKYTPVFSWAPNENQWWITGFSGSKNEKSLIEGIEAKIYNKPDIYYHPNPKNMLTIGSVDLSDYPEFYELLLKDQRYKNYIIPDNDNKKVWIYWKGI
ncbi:MAG: VWA domain-containing protein [Candidatus Weimeria sp.]